ncbi:MAG: hypothetical protein CL815_00805, partial [Coraliomargarita sp.]|nr:hypothetical protein [Coraliomargarita sp.]
MRFLHTIILSIVCTALNAQTFTIVSGSFTWQEAKADAESRGGQLAVIDSQAKQSAAEALIEDQRNSGNEYFIGASPSLIDSQYRWINGALLDFENWAVGEPSDLANHYPTLTTGGWSSINFGEWNDSTSPWVDGYVLEQRFQIIEGSFTWAEAKADAESRGGRLAVLDTQEKIDAANSYLAYLTTWQNLWIGLTDEVEAEDWLWIDGTPISANNWAPGEPNSLGSERYVHIHPSSHPTGPTWNNGKGSHQGYLLELLPSDTDGDGVPDSLEITEGTDPNDENDFNEFSSGIVAWFPFTDSVENMAGTS